MSGDSEGDVLMYFIQKQGALPIQAEATSTLEGGDKKLMQGFQPGRYFEVEDFTFSVSLADDEGVDNTYEVDQRSYRRWRALKENQAKPTPPFRADPQDVTIVRKIDSSSPVLLEHCLKTERFHQAVLVKRARVGSTGAMSAILRIEFDNVWLKAIEWEDGDAVKENCTFKFANVDITYVSRKLDGSVDASFPCSWKST